MPNIYLRLPASRCSFFRNRDAKRCLAPNEPLVFNSYMREAFVLRNGLVNVVKSDCVYSCCFSEQQWNNMLCGRHPLGGKVILKRDKSDYLSYAEVQQLCGKLDNGKSAKEDYLCIKLPCEIEDVDVVRTVTNSWNLSVHGARNLVSVLNEDFKCCLMDWEISTFNYCVSNGRIIVRPRTAMLERFLMRYGIELSVKEKDYLRRSIDRWLMNDFCKLESYSCLDMRYVDSKERIIKINDIKWE